MDKIHEIWPAWHAVELIGRGAFGQVYKARREELGEVFYSAIKVIAIPQDESEVQELLDEGHTSQSVRYYFESIVKDLMNEIKVLEILKSAPNIVNIEDFSVREKQEGIGWEAYIRMELLENLDIYRRKHVMTKMDVVKMGIDLCSALEYCQKSKIVHRDIKPKNIFVDSYGNYKLGDFGIARQMEKTQSTMSRKGTDAYIAPEVRFGTSNSSYSVDVYSLGVVMYRLLNRNRLPFEPVKKELISYQEKEEALAKRLKGEPLPLPVEADEALGNIIVKACEFSKEKRYKSAEEMKKALIQWKKDIVTEQELISEQKKETYRVNERFPEENMEKTRAAFEETKKEVKQDILWEMPERKIGEVLQPEEGRDIRTAVFLPREKIVPGIPIEVYVPELGHKVSVKLPEIIGEEHQFCIQGEGETGKNGGRNGSLYLTIHLNEQKTSAEVTKVEKAKKRLFVLFGLSVAVSCIWMFSGKDGMSILFSTLSLAIGMFLVWKHCKIGIPFVAIGNYFWILTLQMAYFSIQIVSPMLDMILILTTSFGSFVIAIWAGNQASIITKEKIVEK